MRAHLGKERRVARPVVIGVLAVPGLAHDLGRSLGRGMREFKDSVTGKDNDELPPPAVVEKAEPTAAATPTEQKS